MRLYVASAFADFERTRAVHKLARARGHTITEDWARHVDAFPPGAPVPIDFQRESAEADFVGVATADVLIVLTPVAERKDLGCGMWVELGIALSGGVPVVVTGGQHERTIFTQLREIVHVETDAETVIAAEELFRRISK